MASIRPTRRPSYPRQAHNVETLRTACHPRTHFHGTTWLSLLLVFAGPAFPREAVDAVPADAPNPNPTRVEEVYLVPFSHLDLGFTGSVDEVAMACKDTVDQAIRVCEANDDFFWTIESLWQLEQWLLRSTEEDVGRLKALIDAGRIEVGATQYTFRSGMLGLEDANRILYPMQRMHERLGIEFDTAIQNDVPGYADVFPRVLASGGVRYFLTGVNVGHGGGTALQRSEQPFLWQSHDGQSVLTWIDNDSYVAVWGWGVYNIWNAEDSVLPDDGKPFQEAIRGLEESGYPYTVFLLSAALGDNRMPEDYPPLIEGVREWNEARKTPRLRFATPRQFFREIERQQGDRPFRVLKGNWHGLWDARLWNPAGNLLGRQAQWDLPAAEALAARNSLEGVGSYPGYDLRQGFQFLQDHIEHTCGGDPSWIGIFNPNLFRDVALRQNELTVRFAKDAVYAAQRVLEKGMEERAARHGHGRQGVLVFNPLQWRRDAIMSCAIPLSLKEKGFVLVDTATSETVPFVLEGNGAELVFDATDVPALGFKGYSFESPGGTEEVTEAIPARSWGHAIENRFYRVECDPKSGVIKRIVDRETERELVNAEAAVPMNSLLVTAHADTRGPGNGEPLTVPCVVVREEGPFFERLTIERQGSPWPRTTITLPRDSKQIVIRHTLDRDRFPNVSMERHSDYYSFVFPFALDAAALEVFVDGPDGFYQYPDDYLPGAVLGTIQSQGGLHLQEGDAFGVTVSNRQAFNWCVGEINFDRKASRLNEPLPVIFRAWMPPHGEDIDVRPLSPTVFSTVVQFATEGWTADYGRTHIRDTEPGTNPIMEFEYWITTNAGPFDPAHETRFLREAAVLPVGQYLRSGFGGHDGAAGFASEDFLRIEPGNVLVTAFKKAEFGDSEDCILRLKETAGLKSEARIHFALPVIAATRCSITELPDTDAPALSVDPIRLTLDPWSAATVRIRFAANAPLGR